MSDFFQPDVISALYRCKAFVEDQLSISFIPNWSWVASAIPDFLGRLKNAADDDNT
jgi:hypothetical protein